MTTSRFAQTDERQRASATSGVLGKNKTPDFLVEGLRVFKPQDGINTIRLLPKLRTDPHGDVYGFKFYQYFINNKLLCAPDAFDKTLRNPIFEEQGRLYRENQTERAKDFRGTQRHLIFILVFSDDTQGSEVQIWPAPVSVIQSIVNSSRSLLDGEGLIPVEDITEGRKIHIEKTGQGIKTEYKVQLENKATPISEEVAEYLVHFKDLFIVPSVEDCEKLVVSMKQSAAQNDAEVLPATPNSRTFSNPVAAPAAGRFVNDDSEGSPAPPRVEGSSRKSFVVNNDEGVSAAVQAVKAKLPQPTTL